MFAKLLTALTIIAAVSATPDDARAATVVVSYEAGYPDAIINGFGTDGMGTFRLDDGGAPRLALCIEADQPHSTRQGAYVRVATVTPSPSLDTLVWLVERSPIDNDEAIAAAALAWYYAGARRDTGVPVWSDGSSAFQPIGPLAPEPWDALAPLSQAHPIGLRSGSTDLDRAERRLAELHRQVQAKLGPWQLSADPEAGRFTLSGSGGAVAGELVEISISRPDAEPILVQSVTDRHGHVDVTVPEAANGARVVASVSTPGPHQEWDGEGAIQRMITATTIELKSAFDVPPTPRHIELRKHSSDKTIGVEGGVFAVSDSAGVEIERSTSDVGGHVRFSPIEPGRHPAPYTISEVSPPPALERSAPAITISEASADPANPTIVEMIDEPIRVAVEIHKRLSLAAAGPTDRSGFRFEVTRRQDSSKNELVSGPDGVTDPLLLSLGTYDICEGDTPAWAEGLTDGGCQVLDIGLAQLAAGATIAVPYLNVVPTVSIDTAARDAADGDRTIGPDGGQAIDAVELSGLVPGSDYTIVGELLALDAAEGGRPLASVSLTFTAERSDHVVELTFDVPPVGPAKLVITEQLLLRGQIVATHEDLTDLDQTLTVDPPTTTTVPTTTVPTTTVAEPTRPTPTTTPTTFPTAVTAPSPTLPRTGNQEMRRLLRIGDLGFVVGVALIAITGLLPRRRDLRSERSA